MRVALLQYPIAWADKAENLRLTEARIAALVGKADVALLPEMFSTGFCSNVGQLAEPVDGETIRRMQAMADHCDIAVVGTFACRDVDHLVNRAFFLRPGMEPVFADKHHLYAHGGENLVFEPGNQRPVITWRGARFRLIVCNDLRFPAWLRNKTGYDYDILLAMANWPQVRIHFWDALIAARATENQCYICGVNYVGEDDRGYHYNGHSVAYDSNLNPLVHFDDDEEGTKIAEFDLPKLQHYRERVPIYLDNDLFEIITH